MRICVLGLAGVAAEVIFADERLLNIRRLMDFGVYGRVQSVVPASVPSWMCFSTSQDPGSLGVYGPRNRSAYSYDGLVEANSASFSAPTIWDEVIRAGKKAALVGVPPSYPLRQVNGVSVGSFLTRDTLASEFTNPPAIGAKITELVGEHLLGVTSPSGEEIIRMSQKQWQAARWRLAEEKWDYFQFVDVAIDLPGTDQNTLAEYYLFLDEQVGAVLELMDDETILLLVSDRAAIGPEESLDINDWLIREGLLALKTAKGARLPLEPRNVNWSGTRAWSNGEQVFFNMQGREPEGIVSKGEYESLQNEIAAKMQGLNAVALKPGDIYRGLRNVAPDLIVQRGGTPCGMFILTAPNSPLSGEFDGAHLLDMAPTLLDLAGYQIPETMQGRSLVKGLERKTSGGDGNDQLIMDRLAGLGYV